jgi:hypothetical protein
MDSLNVWPDEIGAVAMVQGFANAMAWGALASLLLLVTMVLLFSRMIRRRRFWCARSQREVEVQFEEFGLPGLPYTVSVKTCSMFDPPSAVACRRRCTDVAFRRQWPAALPTLCRGADDV